VHLFDEDQKFKGENRDNALRENTLMNNSDSLVTRLKAGDQKAANEVVDAYYQQIYLFMRRLGHNRQASEDLTQESFFLAWRHIGQLKKEITLSAWLYRIAANASRMYWRKNKKVAVQIELLNISDKQDFAGFEAEDIEQIRSLKEAVEDLPIQLRQAVVLHYMQYLTIAEAADALGLRCGTFKSRLNKALNILRKRLSPDGEL